MKITLIIVYSKLITYSPILNLKFIKYTLNIDNVNTNTRILRSGDAPDEIPRNEGIPSTSSSFLNSKMSIIHPRIRAQPDAGILVELWNSFDTKCVPQTKT